MNVAFNYCQYELKPVLERELTYKDKVYLSALMNTAATEDVMMIGPTASKHGIITPNKAYLKLIVKHLTRRNILITQSNAAGRKRGQKRRTHKLDILENWHKVNVLPTDDVSAFTDRICYLNLKDEENFIDSTYELWLEIAAYEFMAMVEHEAHAFNIKLPELQWKVDESFKSFVSSYSLAQLKTIVIETFDIYIKRHLSGEFDEKGLITRITEDIPYYLQKLNNEGFVPAPTNREINYFVGSSILHTMFFNYICGFNDSIYSLKPSKKVLEIMYLEGK